MYSSFVVLSWRKLYILGLCTSSVSSEQSIIDSISLSSLPETWVGKEDLNIYNTTVLLVEADKP